MSVSPLPVFVFCFISHIFSCIFGLEVGMVDLAPYSCWMLQICGYVSNDWMISMLPFSY